MRVVSVGDLVTDYYYKDNKLIGVCGGMTSHNIIANLSYMNINTAVFGACGNDEAGKIAIDSLNKLGVITDNIEVLNNIKTRCFHVSYNNKEFSSKKRCPECNCKEWYIESLINYGSIIKKLKKDDILVFDNLNNKNQSIINSTKNKKVIDLGQYFELEDMSNDEILNRIKSKFDIINMNERVSNYLIKRFDLKDESALYKLVKCKLLTITKGENGAIFIYKNKPYRFYIEINNNVVDSTGAGDAFFASIIKDWINNNLNIDGKILNTWYENTKKITNLVVSKMGARGHIENLYKIKKKGNICICKDFDVVKRKQIKRCNININNLESRVNNAINNSIINKLDTIKFNQDETYIFIGTGGSYAPALFASTVINKMYGCNTYAMCPRDVIYRNNSKIDKVLLFSYSGTTNDAITSVRDFDNANKYIITKGEVKKIVLKTGISKNNIISYRSKNNKSSERGYLSFEGAVSPAAIFLKYYYSKYNPKFKINDFIKSSITYWSNYFDKLFSDKNIVNTFKNVNTINIFRGDYTNCASYDLESKIIESGIFNAVIHEKKNFSHGRFINYENLDNKCSIYFKQNITSNYEKKLLEYLNNSNNIIIESKYDGLLCEFDLLIASQYIIYSIGKCLDIDVSKPKYSDDALKVYFYKGEL